MFDTLYSITITQAAAALRAGELTSAALVRHALEAVRLHDGTLNAMLRVSASALEEAERCDAEAAQGSFRGPLHGIPLVINRLNRYTIRAVHLLSCLMPNQIILTIS